MTGKLDKAARSAAVKDLTGWSDDAKRDAITRTFVFANFVEAFGFMAQAALVAERMNHHPEWSNVYKTVTVSLTTHEAGGLTMKDVELARAMNAAAKS